MATEAQKRYELVLDLSRLAANQDHAGWAAVVDGYPPEQRASIMYATSMILGFQFQNSAERQGMTFDEFMTDAKRQGQEGLG